VASAAAEGKGPGEEFSNSSPGPLPSAAADATALLAGTEEAPVPTTAVACALALVRGADALPLLEMYPRRITDATNPPSTPRSRERKLPRWTGDSSRPLCASDTSLEAEARLLPALIVELELLTGASSVPASSAVASAAAEGKGPGEEFSSAILSSEAGYQPTFNRFFAFSRILSASLLSIAEENSSPGPLLSCAPQVGWAVILTCFVPQLMENNLTRARSTTPRRVLRIRA
jgi:hypothetical protein